MENVKNRGCLLSLGSVYIPHVGRQNVYIHQRITNLSVNMDRNMLINSHEKKKQNSEGQ